MKMVHFTGTAGRALLLAGMLGLSSQITAQTSFDLNYLMSQIHSVAGPDIGNGDTPPPPPPLGFGTEEERMPSFSFYPAPFNSHLNLLFENSARRMVKIYNLVGNLVREQEIFSREVELNLSDLEKGIYLLNIGDETYRILKA